jgi:hypothetical protein
MNSDRHQELCEQREMLHNEYNAAEHRLRRKKKNSALPLTFDNQKEAATMIAHAYVILDILIVTLIAQMGAGKTGTFLRTAYDMCTLSDDNKILDCESVFIITGMSDVDWQEQTEANTLESFRDRVYHRGRFPQLKAILEKGIKNALVIIDECHIGAEMEHSMGKMLFDAGLLDIENLRRNNIRILEVSATPGHTLNDSLKWGPQNHKIVVLQPGPGYIGVGKMKAQGRLFAPYNLERMPEVVKLADRITSRWGNDNPRWHAIRIGRKGKKVRENLNLIAQQRGWEIKNHDSKDRIGDIDEQMENAPPRHTLILIKDFWRAAKRMKYNFIGICHEPPKNIADTNVESQSLAGRLCDYYPSDYDISKAPLIFTDLSAIDEYIEWINAGGDFEAVARYRSRQLNARNGEVSADPAFTNPSNVKGLEDVAEEEEAERTERLANRTRGVRIPEIISVSAEDIGTIPTGHNKQAKINAVLHLLQRVNAALAAELRDFTCNEITTPQQRDSTSYRNHICVALRKSTNNEPCAVTISEEDRRRGKVWNCFIDKFENRLCFIIVGEV